MWTAAVDAAAATIVERGYYRASSNEIARRAGVTWGAIQHQFGTRQRLLLDVLADRWESFVASVETAKIEGDTLEERLLSLLDVLAEQYGGDAHLVQVQIALDLGQDPATSAAVRRTLRDYGARLGAVWQPLFEQALGPGASPTLIRYTFLTLRGYLAGGLLARSMTEQLADDAEVRRLLVAGVAAVIRQERAPHPA